MIRTLSWKWPIRYGIPLETDPRARCFIRDRWFLWFGSHLWGSEIQVSSRGPKREELGRDADGEFDQTRPALRGTAGPNQASDRYSLSTNAGAAPRGDGPVGQYRRPGPAADRGPAEPRSATTPRALPGPASGAHPALSGGIQAVSLR